MLDMIADTLLAAGAVGAAIYCLVLSRRLKKFNNLQDGMGGAVAVLSAQVDDMTKTLEKARKAAGRSSRELTDLTERAEDVSRKMELMLASMHDLPDVAEAPVAEDPDVRDEPLFLSQRNRVEAAG